MHRQLVNRERDFAARPSRPHALAPWPALVLFGLTFGLLEAVLALDLRSLLDPDGQRYPLLVLPERLLTVEKIREAATLLLLVSVAALLRACGTARFATFLFLFGLWDLAYYAALRVLLGWPRSPADWDLLFLLPVPWLAPVYAPMLIAGVMIFVGVATWRFEARRGCFRVRLRHALAATLGGALCIATFVAHAEARALQALPERYPVEGLIAGVGIAVAGYIDAWRLNRVPSSGATASR